MRSTFERFSPEWWEWMTMPEPNSGCLLWMGCVCKSGYGRIGYRGASSHVLIHRVAYERAFGPFDRSLKILHRCDTPSCVNPDHLFIGSQEYNMRDMFAKGRARPHGSGRKRLQLERGTVSAPVTVRELASQNSHESVVMAYGLHHIRTTAIVAGWRHVTGVPAKRPTTAIVLVKRPEKRTPEPSIQPVKELPAVATVALGWLGSLSRGSAKQVSHA